MHIPDGYLSPETCGVLGTAMVPVWITAGRRVRTIVKSRYVPLVALGAAYCFLVMMFNIPIPDGTTAHAAGAVLVAVLLGPWAAVIAMSTALIIQALFFGDGGVLAIGANCFNMAFVMPFVGYAVYKALTRNTSLTARRRAVAAGLGGYVGLNVAALCAAIEFGLQPMLFTSANGTPLYAPFHLAQTIPAMALAHFVVAGVVEFALTFGVISYLQRANVPVMRINHPGVSDDTVNRGRPVKGWRWALIGVGGMVALTPLGLLAPGGAFGEDSPQALNLGKYGLQAVPTGLNRWASWWNRSVLGGYGFKSGQHPTVAYLISAVTGIVIIAAVVTLGYALARAVGRIRRPRLQPSPT
jgi:cobalt/nickel transport system permease protein